MDFDHGSVRRQCRFDQEPLITLIGPWQFVPCRSNPGQRVALFVGQELSQQTPQSGDGQIVAGEPPAAARSGQIGRRAGAEDGPVGVNERERAQQQRYALCRFVVLVSHDMRRIAPLGRFGDAVNLCSHSSAREMGGMCRSTQQTGIVVSF